jgi:chloramphenicol-sensitive protein RarD
MQSGAEERRKGVLAIIAACAIWGFAPLLYHRIKEVPALEIMAHRTLWTAVLLGGIAAAQGRLGEAKALVLGPDRWRIVAAALLIGFNWGLFIWAVTTNRAVEASLGYYILPLVSAVLGRVVLGERLRRAQVLAIFIATLAVGLLTWGLQVAPVIALALAVSFSAYSAVKRAIAAPALISVLVEVLLIGPPLMALLVWAGIRGGAWGWFGRDAYHSAMLMLMGPISGVPLMLFSYGARRVKLATAGLVAYLNPTLQLASAVLILGEPVTVWHGLALALIWAAIALYSAAAWPRERTAPSA